MSKIEVFDREGKQLTITEVLSQLRMVELPQVTRVEVIDKSGRGYVNWNEQNVVNISVQDEGRTLKLFIKELDVNNGSASS